MTMNPQGPGGYPPPGSYPPPGGPLPGPDSSGKARTALILSCCGILCCICSIIGIVMGVQAQNEMKASGNHNGEGMAKAAVWVGAGLLVLNVLGGFLQFHLMQQRR
jgi:Domain of unknown function (DUF4190)